MSIVIVALKLIMKFELYAHI